MLNDITTKVIQLEAMTPLQRAVKCWEDGLDDAANLLCGKALEEMLCLAWLTQHMKIFEDLINGRITKLKNICDGSTCHAQPCQLTQRATLDPLIHWGVKQSLLDSNDRLEAEYVRDKRNDHGHAYAMRLYGKSGGTASILGSDPDTEKTIKRTIELVGRIKARYDALAINWYGKAR